MAIEMVWRRPGTAGHSVKPWLLTAYLVALWLLWVGDMRGLLWIGIYALLLLKVVSGVGLAAQSLVAMRGSTTLAGKLMNVLVVRGVRALVITASVGWLMFVGRSSPTMAAMGLSAERLAQGLLKCKKKPRTWPDTRSPPPNPQANLI